MLAFFGAARTYLALRATKQIKKSAIRIQGQLLRSFGLSVIRNRRRRLKGIALTPLDVALRDRRLEPVAFATHEYRRPAA